MEDRDLQLARVRLEILLQPLVLRAAGRPVVVEVVLVLISSADVIAGPGCLKDVDPDIAGVEGIPGARVAGRGGAVETAVGLADVLADRRRNGAVLRPAHEVRVRIGRAGHVVVAIGDEDWD
jgi:hypothetical protein